jgi:hypothetical protein
LSRNLERLRFFLKKIQKMSSFASSSSSTSAGSPHPVIQTKLNKLNEAFLKTLDISMSQLTESDFQECFSKALSNDVNKQLLNSFYRIYVNIISEVGRKLENEEFPRINTEHNLKETLEVLHQLPPSASSSSPSEGNGPVSAVDDPNKQFRALIKAVKRSEVDDLNNGIKFLEGEIKKSKDLSGRLRTQMVNEIEALNEENMKLLHASNQS